MKALAFFSLLAIATSCNSTPSVNPFAARLHKEHEEILNINKSLFSQAAKVQQNSLDKLASITDESTITINEFDKLDASRCEESEQIGIVNQIALKHSILLLAAQDANLKAFKTL